MSTKNFTLSMRQFYIIVVVVIVAVVCIFSGYYIFSNKETQQTISNSTLELQESQVNKLVVNMSMDDVHKILGTPLATSVIKEENIMTEIYATKDQSRSISVSYMPINENETISQTTKNKLVGYLKKGYTNPDFNQFSQFKVGSSYGDVVKVVGNGTSLGLNDTKDSYVIQYVSQDNKLAMVNFDIKTNLIKEININ